MADKASTRLHRVTELFETGREIVLRDDGPVTGTGVGSEPVLVWVNKLNTFQRGDAQRDGQAAQARRLASLTDDSDEIRAVVTRLDLAEPAEVIEYVLMPLQAEARVAARDDVLAEPDWFEKRGLLERAVSLEEGGNPPTEEERAAQDQLLADFESAIGEATAKRVAEAREELAALDPAALRRRYLDTWRNNVSTNVLYEEYGRAELYYALRDCNGRRSPDGVYLHTSCTHQRLLPNRAAVTDLPQDLVDRVRRVIDQLSMTPSDAGFSVAPESSSASSEPPSSAEASTPSTQEETPPPLDGT